MNRLPHDMTASPLPVSICIPTYNGEKYLEACLDSILAQTFTDLEILIVDDQSTDRTFEIAQAYAIRDKRIRVVRNKVNMGLPGNWNQCLLLARGEWLKFLFQDDLLEAECVERMLGASVPDIPIIACKRNVIFEGVNPASRSNFQWHVDKYSMDRIFEGKTVIGPEIFSTVVLDNWLHNFVGEPTAVMLHRSVVNRFGLFNPHLIQICDLEYWIRVASHTGLVYVPEALATFRLHGNGTSMVNKNKRNFRIHLDELVCYHEFLFDPLYEPLRGAASQRRPPVMTDQWFAARVQQTYRLARKASKDHSNPDPRLLEDLAEIAQLFPGFSIVKKIPFSRCFGEYKWKIQNCFSSPVK